MVHPHGGGARPAPDPRIRLGGCGVSPLPPFTPWCERNLTNRPGRPRSRPLTAKGPCVREGRHPGFPSERAEAALIQNKSVPGPRRRWRYPDHEARAQVEAVPRKGCRPGGSIARTDGGTHGARRNPGWMPLQGCATLGYPSLADDGLQCAPWVSAALRPAKRRSLMADRGSCRRNGRRPTPIVAARGTTPG